MFITNPHIYFRNLYEKMKKLTCEVMYFKGYKIYLFISIYSISMHIIKYAGLIHMEHFK